jgi:LPXTG-motif cell wall-anchored protein
MPTGPVDTGAGGTAGPDNTGLIAAGGIALTIGAGGVILASRRNRA